MLGHSHAGGSAQNRGGGGNIERAQTVAARADDVENLVGRAPIGFNWWQDGLRQQRGCECGDFLRRLAFAGQRDEEFRLGGRGNHFVRQAGDSLAHLLRRQMLGGGELKSKGFQHAAILRGNAKGTN